MSRAAVAGVAVVAALVAAGAILKQERARLATATPAGTVPVPSLRVGENSVVRLQGNPSTGYTWSVNFATSANLDIVTIEDLGYASSPPPISGEPPNVGAPQEQNFRVTGKAIGEAKLTFDYSRPWEGEAIESKVIRIEVQE